MISGARVGGSNLMHSIAKGSNQPYKFELDIIKDWHLVDPSLHVCKYIPFYDQSSPDFSYDFFKLVEVDKVVEKAKQFGKVLIVNRRDKMEQTESLYALKMQNDSRNYVRWDESLVDRDSQLFKNLYAYNLEIDKCLKYFSDVLNIKIDYYEDVYSSKTLNDPSIVLDYKYFSPVRKLRKKFTKKVIL